MLLSFPDILRSDPAAEQDIRKSVDFMLSLEYNGNYPSSMGHADPQHRRPEEKELVQWCHGAPGNRNPGKPIEQPLAYIKSVHKVCKHGSFCEQ